MFNQGSLSLFEGDKAVGVDLLGAVFSNSGTITLDRYCSMGNGILVSNAGEILVEEQGHIYNWTNFFNAGTISLGYGHQLENLGLLRQNGTLKAVDGEALVENRGLVVNTFGEIETKPSAALKFYHQDLIPEELPVAVDADALLAYQAAETACRVGQRHHHRRRSHADLRPLSLARRFPGGEWNADDGREHRRL